jgi:hypothetical protein
MKIGDVEVQTKPCSSLRPPYDSKLLGLTKEEISFMIQLEDGNNVKNNKLNVCKSTSYDSWYLRIIYKSFS